MDLEKVGGEWLRQVSKGEASDERAVASKLTKVKVKR